MFVSLFLVLEIWGAVDLDSTISFNSLIPIPEAFAVFVVETLISWIIAQGIALSFEVETPSFYIYSWFVVIYILGFLTYLEY